MFGTILFVLLALFAIYIFSAVRTFIRGELTAPKAVVYLSAFLALVCAFIPTCIAMSPRLSYDYEDTMFWPLAGIPVFLLIFIIAKFVSWERN